MGQQPENQQSSHQLTGISPLPHQSLESSRKNRNLQLQQLNNTLHNQHKQLQNSLNAQQRRDMSPRGMHLKAVLSPNAVSFQQRMQSIEPPVTQKIVNSLQPTQLNSARGRNPDVPLNQAYQTNSNFA